MIIAIAGPYSAPTAELRKKNLEKLNKAAIVLLELGHTPLIGINAALPIIEQSNRTDSYNDIMKISLALLHACDALWLTAESPGAIIEKTRMLEMGKPIYYSLEEIKALNK